MPDIRKLFENAAVAAGRVEGSASDDDLCALQALYLQATRGDVAGEPPGSLDAAGAARHEAWTRLKGMSSAEAMQKYIARVNALKG